MIGKRSIGSTPRLYGESSDITSNMQRHEQPCMGDDDKTTVLHILVRFLFGTASKSSETLRLHATACRRAQTGVVCLCACVASDEPALTLRDDSGVEGREYCMAGNSRFFHTFLFWRVCAVGRQNELKFVRPTNSIHILY